MTGASNLTVSRRSGSLPTEVCACRSQMITFQSRDADNKYREFWLQLQREAAGLADAH